MKILWLSHIVPYPPKAGVLQRSYNMLNETAKYHDVDLLTFVQNDFFNQIYKNPQEGIAEAKVYLEKICSKVEFVPIENEGQAYGKYILAFKSLFTKYPYTINWLKSKVFSRLIEQWVAHTQYDLVHFDTISLAPYLDNTQNIPGIMNHHNIESHLLIRRASVGGNFISKYYYHQEGIRLENYEKEQCRKFNLNITCSKMDAERLEQIDSDILTEVVPNGVALQNISNMPDVNNDKSILFIGTLNWDPNTKAVIYLAEKIWPLLKKQHPDVTCDIIGTHPPKELIELSKRDSSFRVHGFVSDLGDFLKPGAIFVCPIKDGGGTKLKILDALAMKAAVVADPIACEGIDITDKKDVLLASTPEEYVQMISDIFESKDLRLKLGENARLLIESMYSYESIGKSLSALYELAIKESK